MGAFPTTHIANACDRPIWAKCDTDRKHALTFGFNAIGVQANLDNSTSGQLVESGLTKINPGRYLGFKPMIGIFGANWFNRTTVYITIYYEDKDGTQKLICGGFPKASNESVIVAADYTLRVTKMGYLWTDSTGTKHNDVSNEQVSNSSWSTLFTLNNTAAPILGIYSLSTTVCLILFYLKYKNKL